MFWGIQENMAAHTCHLPFRQSMTEVNSLRTPSSPREARLEVLKTIKLEPGNQGRHINGANRFSQLHAIIRLQETDTPSASAISDMYLPNTLDIPNEKGVRPISRFDAWHLLYSTIYIGSLWKFHIVHKLPARH